MFFSNYIHVDSMFAYSKSSWHSSNKIILPQEEHEAIVRNRENPNSRFTWEEYKSLTFTTLVILMLVN
jgi:hypothetical protein